MKSKNPSVSPKTCRTRPRQTKRSATAAVEITDSTTANAKRERPCSVQAIVVLGCADDGGWESRGLSRSSAVSLYHWVSLSCRRQNTRRWLMWRLFSVWAECVDLSSFTTDFVLTSDGKHGLYWYVSDLRGGGDTHESRQYHVGYRFETATVNANKMPSLWDW